MTFVFEIVFSRTRYVNTRALMSLAALTFTTSEWRVTPCLFTKKKKRKASRLISIPKVSPERPSSGSKLECRPAWVADLEYSLKFHQVRTFWNVHGATRISDFPPECNLRLPIDSPVLQLCSFFSFLLRSEHNLTYYTSGCHYHLIESSKNNHKNALQHALPNLFPA